MVVTNYQVAKILNPRNRPLDFPTTMIASQLASVLQRRLHAVDFVRADQVRAVCLQSQPQCVAVRRLVVNQPFDMRSRSTATDFRNTNCLKRLLDQFDFVRGRGRQEDTQGDTSGFRNDHDFRAFPFLCLSDGAPPFLAGENVPSAKHSSQWRRDLASSIPSNICQSSSRTFCSYQNFNRSHKVLPDGNHFGTSLYLAPLRNNQRMPSRHARFGAGICPPFGERGGSGKSSSRMFHSFSVNSSPVLYSRLRMEIHPLS